jgi:single-strand DNA-binding protein
MNKCILIGNLTKDPELSTTTNGVAVCRFSIAVSRRYSNSDGERETDFLNIVVWRSLGENCHKFLKKGSKVGVVGNIQSRSYDAADGTKRYVTEIVAEEVEFLSTRNSDEPARTSSEEVSKLQPIDDDGLPF